MSKQNNKKEYMCEEKPLLYYVEWIDHCSLRNDGTISWEDLDDLTALSPVTGITVGWVMSEGKEHITVVPTYMEEAGTTHGGILIIKSCIKKSVKLKDPTNWEVIDNKALDKGHADGKAVLG